MWYVYIIECKDGKLYTGITNNIDRRITEHNSGHGGRFTKYRRPVELIYYREMFTKSAALKEELKIKRLKRREKLILVKLYNFWHKITHGEQIKFETTEDYLSRAIKVPPIQKLRSISKMHEFMIKQPTKVVKKIKRHLIGIR